jgi:hypothetical protein
MMALFGTLPDWLLEGEILLPPPQEEITHRCMRIGLSEDDIGGDRDRRIERDRIGGIPSAAGEGVMEFPIRSHECDVDRIARMATPGLRPPRSARKRRVGRDEAVDGGHGIGC